MEPVRSWLYVPAIKEEWIHSAPRKYPADAFIFDLEDSVPETTSDKRTARENLKAAADVLRTTDAVVTVRINGPRTEYFEDDLDAIVGLDVDMICLPELSTVEEVQRTDHIISYLEHTRETETSIELIALPESAYGLNNVYELCAASDRVVSVVGGTAKDGGPQRALGYEFTPEGRERQYLLSKVVLEARAAGVNEITSGAWMDIEDFDGLEREMKFVRQLGYTSTQVIHPSHLEIINKVFTPDQADVARAKRLIEAYEAAVEGESTSAIRFEGELVDTSHAKTAKKLVERAKAFDVD